jgi:hypothetical protein
VYVCSRKCRNATLYGSFKTLQRYNAYPMGYILSFNKYDYQGRVRCYNFYNIFAKKLAKKLELFTQTTASICKKIDHNILGFFLEKRHFFVENCQKSQKIVIITSTPPRSKKFAFVIKKGSCCKIRSHAFTFLVRRHLRTSILWRRGLRL